jgi:hypothetical protein
VDDEAGLLFRRVCIFERIEVFVPGQWDRKAGGYVAKFKSGAVALLACMHRPEPHDLVKIFGVMGASVRIVGRDKPPNRWKAVRAFIP